MRHRTISAPFESPLLDLTTDCICRNTTVVAASCVPSSYTRCLLYSRRDLRSCLVTMDQHSSTSSTSCLGCYMRYDHEELVRQKHQFTPCCSRLKCEQCLDKHVSFRDPTYCPWCNNPTAMDYDREPEPTPPPPIDLIENPPSYQEATEGWQQSQTIDHIISRPRGRGEKDKSDQFLVHHVRKTDTMTGLSLRYNVTIDEIRKVNHLIYSNASLQTHRAVLIPVKPTTRIAPPAPPTIEEQRDDAQKICIKRWQMRTKDTSRNLGRYYLEQVDWDVEAAIRNWQLDNDWEKQNPVNRGKGKAIAFRP